MLYLDLRLTALQNILVASLTPIWVKITDFGISKRWVGTSLKTQCGTAIYRSPEQLGILPREFRILGNSYTNNIDIWAIGAIVHEMLTLEIPFLEGPIDNAGFTSCLSIAEATVDTGLLYGYCHGKEPFPSASLCSHGVPEDGIQFVKSLMAVNPSERLSAAAALACEWLVQTNCPASPDLVLPARLPVAASPASPEPPAQMEEKNTVVDPSRVPHPLRTEEKKQAVVDPAAFSEPPAPKNEIHVVINSRRIPASPPTETEEQPITDLATYPKPLRWSSRMMALKKRSSSPSDLQDTILQSRLPAGHVNDSAPGNQVKDAIDPVILPQSAGPKSWSQAHENTTNKPGEVMRPRTPRMNGEGGSDKLKKQVQSPPSPHQRFEPVRTGSSDLVHHTAPPRRVSVNAPSESRKLGISSRDRAATTGQINRAGGKSGMPGESNRLGQSPARPSRGRHVVDRATDAGRSRERGVTIHPNAPPPPTPVSLSKIDQNPGPQIAMKVQQVDNNPDDADQPPPATGERLSELSPDSGYLPFAPDSPPLSNPTAEAKQNRRSFQMARSRISFGRKQRSESPT